jgi:AraC-like DNA-binding protein
MTSGEETLASIAETAGFGSAFHLSSAFKKVHGVSPDIWRRQIKESPPHH